MARRISEIREEMVDREAIRDTLMRYCRGSDRCDEEMIRECYWPDAHDDHMEFSGNPEEFLVYSTPILQGMRYNQHKLGNVLMVIDGDRAESESYFTGYHSVPAEDGSRHDVFAGGRYMDHFERRDDEWRIQKRFVIVDWFRECPDTCDWENGGPFGMGDKVTRGDLAPADLSSSYFKLL